MGVFTSISHRPRLRSWQNLSLVGLLGFTVVAVIGYGTFALHPQLLAGYPKLAEFYGISYAFFAQVHVWLTGLVIGLYLIDRTGFRWVSAFAWVYMVSLTSELVGTGYGLPFGEYAYTDLLGAQWFGKVPIVIPLSWFAMALPAYGLASYRFEADQQWIARTGYATALLVAWDLSLDPAMSYLTAYWQWAESGAYYGMPLINLFGWALTGGVIMGIFEVLNVRDWIYQTSPGWMRAYYLIVLAMPVGMLVAAGAWTGAVATTVVVGSLLWMSRSSTLNRPVNPSANGHPSRTGRALDPEDSSVPRAFFRHHSRSFSFAALWFAQREYELVTCLYAFCRTTDDIVDQFDGDPVRAEEQLDAWNARARRAYRGQATGLPWLDRIMSESAAAGVPFQVIEDLVDGVRMDLGTVALENEDELDRYAYHVASVVGIWMCYLFTDPDEEMLRRAAAMGRAMQITNIIRDVGEDLREDRVYLPATMLRRHGIDRSDLESMAGGAPITSGYESLMEELMHRADAAYAYAFRGLPDLPPAFRRASAVAAEVYRGIHQEVRRNGFDNLSNRAYTGSWQKLTYTVRGLLRLVRVRSSRLRRRYEPDESVVPAGDEYLSRLGFALAFCMLTVPTAAALGDSNAGGIPGGHASAPDRDNHTANVRPANAAPDTVVDRIREMYVQSVEHEAMIDSARRVIESRGDGSPVLRAYDAALVILRAKHTFWPPRKMNYLNRGLPVLDTLVTGHPEHVEIRYLRLLSCYFLPRFLGRNWSVEEDFEALIELLPQAADRFPNDLYREMLAFVLGKGSPTDHQEAILSAALEQASSGGSADASS